MSSIKMYIGDGVYADFDGYHIVLSTNDVDINTKIFLEPSVYSNLKRYVKSIVGFEA